MEVLKKENGDGDNLGESGRNLKEKKGKKVGFLVKLDWLTL